MSKTTKHSPEIDWEKTKRVLIVRLRSIGDTVLATPSLAALRRFLPSAEIDILLEEWVAPLLEGFEGVNVIAVGKDAISRIKTACFLRRRNYDVALNLHGGTTATFFVRASGARHRVGFANYQYAFLYNHLLSSAADFWRTETNHSAEQQLALLGFIGVPVEDRPKSSLAVTESANKAIDNRLAESAGSTAKFALIHPAAAFATKTWAVENFARTAEFLAERGLSVVAIAAPHEKNVLEKLREEAAVPVTTFSNLTLPEITALAARSSLFIGNDSGIAHIAAAVQTPTVVIFGSSNRDHWYPWTDAPNALVYEEFPCQPCPGYDCKQFGEPKCILGVNTNDVSAAIDSILATT